MKIRLVAAKPADSGEDKNFLPLLGIDSRFLSCPACSLVTGGTISVPTIVNGVTKVNCNVKSDQKYSNLTEDCINKLKQTFNECNKYKYALCKKKTHNNINW